MQKLHLHFLLRYQMIHQSQNHLHHQYYQTPNRLSLLIPH